MKTIQDQIKEKEAEIAAKQKELDNFELDPDNHEKQYDEMLDSEGPVNIGGIKFDVSYALQQLDPTAYRCGMNDWLDGLDKEQDHDYQALQSEMEALEVELADLENELEDEEDD